jgi:hypothetical protein
MLTWLHDKPGKYANGVLLFRYRRLLAIVYIPAMAFKMLLLSFSFYDERSNLHQTIDVLKLKFN